MGDRRGSSGLVLVDTGLGTLDYADMTSRLTRSFVYGYARPEPNPAYAAIHQIRALGLDPADVRHIVARPEPNPAYAAIHQIRALGLDPADVRHIVMTHMDLDHVGGLADFPHATVHLHAAEWKQCSERRSFRDRHRYLPAMWAHGIITRTYAQEGEPWFGFEAVRELDGLPPEILLVPLFGHTLGHCGVAIDTGDRWLLHAGDAYFDEREVKGERRRCAWQVGAFQALVQTDRRQRLCNQDRLRAFTAAHPEVSVFCVHNPWELQQSREHDGARHTLAIQPA